MMRASRPATAPIMPETAVSRNTGATASWMPWVIVVESRGNAIAILVCGRRTRGQARDERPGLIIDQQRTRDFVPGYPRALPMNARHATPDKEQIALLEPFERL